MTRYLYLLLIGLISLAMVAIILMQFFWIREAIKTNEELFDKNTHEVLSEVVKKLERRDVVLHILKYSDSIDSKQIVKFNNSDSIFFNSCIKRPQIQHHTNKKRSDTLNTTAEIIIEISNDSSPAKSRIKYTGWSNVIIDNTEKFDWKIDKNDSLKKHINKKIKLLKEKKSGVEDIIRQIEIETKTDSIQLENRIRLGDLRSLMIEGLKNKGINSAFEYAILDKKLSFNIMVYRKNKSDGYNQNYHGEKYQTRLFPEGIFNAEYYLEVYFPDKQTYIINSLGIMLYMSICFTLFMCFVFGAALYIVHRQKKISDVKSDFINNMTHEFKTPIATISVALDALGSPKMKDDKVKMEYFNSQIRQSNNRMNSLVEHVLQMSLLDKKQLTINQSIVDLHKLIEKAASNFMMQIERKSGKLILELTASEYFASVDEIHFANVIFNLIDNAIKYSPEKPEITISTKNIENKIVISVSDIGIGIKKEDRLKIFEKFYRVNTGNIHNVKGYGLGLSYSKSIVDLHKGEIIVRSEFGKGTTFEILMPLASIQNGNGKT